MNDPSGLLGRIPELEALCQEPSIRRAIESGDPFKVYRALFFARLFGKLGVHRETIKSLLGNRRLFARPIKGPPYLGTINSVGVGFVGNSEPDSTGTHIATHAFVILFAIPLLPLGAYVVKKIESGGSWNIYARVPLGPVAWLWNRAVALCAVASVAVAASGAIHAARYQKVRVINGFDVPIEVSIGDSKAMVPAAADAVLDVKAGHHAARASARGIEVDALDLEVVIGRDVFAWNVAGAMPVLLVDIVYSSQAKDPNAPSPPPREVFCGKRVIQLGSIDYAFREPAKSLSVSKGSDRVVKTWVGYADGGRDATGTCLAFLAKDNRAKEALGFMLTAARLALWEPRAVRPAVEAAFAVSAEEALRIAREARDARHEEVEAHRTYQWIAERAGRVDEMAAEYRARAEAAPDSADAQYLHARLLQGPPARESVEKLSARFPDHVYLLRLLAYRRFCAGEWAGVTQAWERLQARSAESAAELADEELWSLAAQGRRADALALARTLFTKGNAPGWLIAERFARISALEGSKAPDELIARTEQGKDHKNWLLRQRSGLPVPATADAPALALYRSATRSPSSAMRLSARSSQLEVSLLTRPVWSLLYLEAVRTGNGDAAKSLARSTDLPAAVLSRLGRFVRGDPEPVDDLDLHPEVRAAAFLVRSRNSALPHSERKQLLERARRLDVLRGPVTDAIAAWTA